MISYQNNLLHQVKNDGSRYLYKDLKTEERLLGIKGLRGVGKTTLLLQYLKFSYTDFENTNFVYALQENPDRGSVRETFFANQLRNAGFQVNLNPANGDFIVNDTYTFEVGRKNKGQKQTIGAENGYLAIDEAESGFANRIPLWRFGFLY